MKSSILLRIGIAIFLIAFAVASPAAQANLVAIDQDSTNLYAVSSSDATLTLIGATGIDDFGSLEFRDADGFLYGITTGVNSALYRIDASDASTTLIGSLGISTFEGGLAFATDGTAYGVNGGSTTVPILYQLNMETGEATLIAAFADRHDFDGLGWHGDGLIGKFAGRQLAQWTHDTFPESACVLSIDVKKFFMDEWSGVADVKQMNAIGKALKSTVPGVLAELKKLEM